MLPRTGKVGAVGRYDRRMARWSRPRMRPLCCPHWRPYCGRRVAGGSFRSGPAGCKWRQPLWLRLGAASPTCKDLCPSCVWHGWVDSFESVSVNAWRWVQPSFLHGGVLATFPAAADGWPWRPETRHEWELLVGPGAGVDQEGVCNPCGKGPWHSPEACRCGGGRRSLAGHSGFCVKVLGRGCASCPGREDAAR